MARRTEMILAADKNAHQEVSALLDSADRVQKSLPLSDLSAFRRDLLFTISSFEGTETAPSGVAIAETLQAIHTESLTQGRFYQNFRELVTDDLVEKRPIDGRTSAYYLSLDCRGARDASHLGTALPRCWRASHPSARPRFERTDWN